MRKQSKAIDRLCDQKSKVSSHYFIKNNGEILTLVPDFYIAWHAGKSKWKRFKSLNKYSIGIEINNPGHDNKYKSFTRNQILSTQKLIKLLIKKYKINYKNVLGHSDIAPTRKKDPGEKFPWNKLAKKKLCLWHTLDTKKIRINRKKSLNASQEKKFLRTLYNIGYSKINESRKNKTVLIKAFQRRFRQSLVNGYADKECYLIGKNLLNS